MLRCKLLNKKYLKSTSAYIVFLEELDDDDDDGGGGCGGNQNYSVWLEEDDTRFSNNDNSLIPVDLHGDVCISVYTSVSFISSVYHCIKYRIFQTDSAV